LAVWKREQDPGDRFWDFFSKLAATAIIQGEIATLMETTLPSEIGVIDENGGAVESLVRFLNY
jgi:hypothetical protein